MNGAGRSYSNGRGRTRANGYGPRLSPRNPAGKRLF